MNLTTEMNRIGKGAIAMILQDGGANLSRFAGATRVDVAGPQAAATVVPVPAPGA